MIADLKADSERWEAERRQTASRGQPSNGISLRDSDGIVRKSNTPIVGYRDSATHQTRQYYGPTEPGQPTGYAPSSSASTPLGGYDSGPQYQQQGYPQPSGYSQQQGYPVQDNYYVAGADYGVAGEPRSRVPATSSAVNVPRSNTYASSTPSYQQPESRTPYYPGQPTPVTQAQQVYAPQDPYYGRGAYKHQPLPLSLVFKREKSLTF